MVDRGEEGGASGEGSHGPRRRNHYQRHTAEQIQRLEGVYNECTHPSVDVRMQLSRELGLSLEQIKFWFQNRRTQSKAQQERAETVALHAENYELRQQMSAIKDALERALCPACDPNDQNLQEENARLKEELQRLSSDVAKYMRRPISELSHGIADGPSPSLDLISDNSPTTDLPPFAYTSADLLDKSSMVDIASNAMDELTMLLNNEPFWMNSSSDGRKLLNLEAYENAFPRAIKSPNVRIESSKDSGIVFMNSLALVEIFMDANKWMEVFPTIVSEAKTIDVILTGPMGSQNGLLQLMYEGIQVISPLVPIRQFYFLRFCQQLEQNLWAIVDVSYDIPQVCSNAEFLAHRLPSGCYIEDMLNGHSKITWMEHMQIEDRRPIHNFYREHIFSGLAFGAERRLATLQRMCERFTCQMDSSTSFLDLEGVINRSPHGKRYLMKLAHRMFRIFCSSINRVDGQQRMISEMNDYEVHTTLRKCIYPGQPTARVFNAATTIWLPFSPQKIFNFLRKEYSRPQWDILPNYNYVQEIGRIAWGSHSGNCISLLRGFRNSKESKLILQESCIDSSAALVVHCHVDLPAINIAMTGGDLSFIPFCPSGFVISRDGKTSGELSGGALVTVALQIIDSYATSGNISQESANRVNKFMAITINQLKAALNLSTFET